VRPSRERCLQGTDHLPITGVVCQIQHGLSTLQGQCSARLRVCVCGGDHDTTERRPNRNSKKRSTKGPRLRPYHHPSRLWCKVDASSVMHSANMAQLQLREGAANAHAHRVRTEVTAAGSAPYLTSARKMAAWPGAPRTAWCRHVAPVCTRHNTNQRTSQRQETKGRRRRGGEVGVTSEQTQHRPGVRDGD
jgi:hypothetical protein